MRVRRIVERLDTDGDGQVSFTEFQDFNKQYPALLFPAFEMQQSLRTRIKGQTYWEKMTRERFRKHGRSANVFEILSKMTEDSFKGEMDKLTDDFRKPVPEKKHHSHKR